MARKKTTTGKVNKKSSVLIVDDHPIVRRGLAELINQQPDLAVCGQAGDADEALKAIKDTNPNVAVVDISLRQTSGIELIKDIKVRYPRLVVLALSMHDETLYAERVLRAGASGYIMKQEATEEVISAIRTVLAGQIYASERMKEKMMRKLVTGASEPPASAVGALSDRELEVFTLIGQGFSTRRIAEKLYISIKTVETYRSHIKEKLNLADSSELLQYAIQWVTAHQGR